MSTGKDRYEFSCQGLPVGSFDNEYITSVPGRFMYLPYRGPGHYELEMSLQRGQRPRCTIGSAFFLLFLSAHSMAF